MDALNFSPQTKHFRLTPRQFRDLFYYHKHKTQSKYEFRIVCGTCSVPVARGEINRAILQNKCTAVIGFTTSTAPGFVMITEMLN